jgi:hypothetical protein
MVANGIRPNLGCFCGLFVGTCGGSVRECVTYSTAIAHEGGFYDEG